MHLILAALTHFKTNTGIRKEKAVNKCVKSMLKRFAVKAKQRCYKTTRVHATAMHFCYCDLHLFSSNLNSKSSTLHCGLVYCIDFDLARKCYSESIFHDTYIGDFESVLGWQNLVVQTDIETMSSLNRKHQGPIFRTRPAFPEEWFAIRS